MNERKRFLREERRWVCSELVASGLKTSKELLFGDFIVQIVVEVLGIGVSVVVNLFVVARYNVC